MSDNPRNILLLYDTNEKDLARDFNDLLEEVNIGSIRMIPLEPDKGLTLQEKERQSFESSDGAIFIITPGSERLGKSFPSPSVSHEMGQAQQKFSKKPENVIYLVDDKCNMPSIDQKGYVLFNRGNIRSILSAITQLFKNLKSAGLFRTNPIPTQTVIQPKKINLDDFVKTLEETIKNVLFDLSNMKNGLIEDSELTKHLLLKYKLSVQEINFLERDLLRLGVVVHHITDKTPYANYWWLNELGWNVVSLEIRKKKEQEKKSITLLTDLIKSGYLNEIKKKHLF